MLPPLAFTFDWLATVSRSLQQKHLTVGSTNYFADIQAIQKGGFVKVIGLSVDLSRVHSNPLCVSWYTMVSLNYNSIQKET